MKYKIAIEETNTKEFVIEAGSKEADLNWLKKNTTQGILHWTLASASLGRCWLQGWTK